MTPRRRHRLSVSTGLLVAGIAISAASGEAGVGLSADRSVPVRCGTCERGSTSAGVGAITHDWRCVPSVIRADGADSFRIEVGVDHAIEAVRLEHLSTWVLADHPDALTFRDDGSGMDRRPGDRVFTGGPFRYDANVVMPDHFAYDLDSPPGLFQFSVGVLVLRNRDGFDETFLVNPSMGLLSPGAESVRVIRPQSGVQLTPHLVNISSPDRTGQQALRLIQPDLAHLLQRLYSTVPDEFEFLTLFTTNRVELLPQASPVNFNAGVHFRVQTEFTGTALPLMDDSARFGSDGVLLGVSVLDAFDRGLNGSNATHELLHHWSAYAPAFSLTTSGHYVPESNAASLVGGFEWTPDNTGGFVRNCAIGRNGAFRASDIDLYFMGVLPGDEVADLRVSDPLAPLVCGQAIPQPAATVSVPNVVAAYGLRTPLPTMAQREFRVAFAVASHDRLLTETELTFFDRLAAHYTAIPPTASADPYVGENWVTVARFFTEFTSWRSKIPLMFDYDGDGDVDEVEFALTRDCLTGPAELPIPVCDAQDHHVDGRIDLRDVADLQRFFSGPGWP